MPGFSGFPAGRNPYVPLPEQFFTHVLPEIDDLAEIKVTLHLFWLLSRQRGTPRCASDRALAADPLLRRALRRRGDPRPPEERVRAGLEQALARGTLLRVRVRVNGEVVSWYFFHTARGRRAVERLLRGELAAERLLELEGLGEAGRGETTTRAPLVVEIERPNIFTLYERNIGLLLPMVAEELRDAAERYPEEWLEAAFREAVQQNKRSWSYVRAILRRWDADGRGRARGTHERHSR